MLSGFAPQTSADELGRLFFSAEERQILNQKRIAPIREAKLESVPKADSEPTAALAPAESVPLPPPKITGQVLRSSGNNTIWMNHFPQYKRGKR